MSTSNAKFECQFCEYSTDRLRLYLAHRFQHCHVNNGNYYCGYNGCSSIFSTEHLFRLHVLRYHKVRSRQVSRVKGVDELANDSGKYVCALRLCKKELDNYKLLLKHLKQHMLEGISVECPHIDCHFAYSKVSSFTGHLTTHHRDLSPEPRSRNKCDGSDSSDLSTDPDDPEEVETCGDGVSDSDGADKKYVMAAFSYDRQSKVYVKANSVKDTINLIKAKFKLPENICYRLYQEDNGFLIDDDEILVELCQEKAPPEKFHVMLLPPNTPWLDPQEQIDLALCPDSAVDLAESLSTSNGASASKSSSNSSSVCDTDDARFPWGTIRRVLDPVLDYLNLPADQIGWQEAKRRKDRAIHDVVVACGNYMMNALDDYKRGTAGAIAKKIVLSSNGKYQKVFGTYCGSILMDIGVESFLQSLYGYVSIRKPDDKKNKHLIGRPERKKRRTEEQIRKEEEEQEYDLHPPNNQEEYGCVNFEIELPGNETEATQERKRVEILSLTNHTDGKAAELMSATYYLQRQDLIYKLKPALHKLPGIINRWPLLAQSDFLVAHAKVLLGKDVFQVWQNNMSFKASSLLDFMTFYFSRLGQCKDEAMCKRMTNIISQVKEINSTTRSDAATYSGIFPLIVGFMKNRENQLINLMPKLSTDNEVRAEAKRTAKGFPILVIRGDTMFDTDSILHVVVVNQILIKVKNIPEGLLIHLLCYFVFNFVYQPSLHSTLEFFQRFFLEVNPPRGSRRPVAKRIVGEIDKDVKRLQKKLATFDARKWALPHCTM